MQTGVTPKFRFNRELDAHERGHSLRRDRQEPFSPNESLALTRFNSSFVEFVDRGLRQRGMLPAWVAAISGVILFSVLLVSPYFAVKMYEDSFSFAEVIFTSFVVLMWYVLLPLALVVFVRISFSSFFSYKYFPIRFNRRTRKVYFFRHNGPGGAVTVDWDDPNVYFHIGRGSNQKYLRDLRCHILENHEVKQTFAIGHYWWHENSIRKEWEFIRRYMELGPEECFDHPADKVISLSTEMNWANCLNHAYFMGPADFIKIGRLLYPFYAVIAFGRWLAMKTCKQPQWQPEVERDCAIDENDPHRLPEPKISGEFDTPEGIERSRQAFLERERWEKEVL